MEIDWKPLVRDIAIVWVAQNLGGLVVGFMGALLVGRNAIADPRVQMAGIFSNFIFGVVGFTIVGALARTDRFKHLLLVGLCVWLIGLSALLVIPMTLKQWFIGGGLFQVLIVLIGCGLSFLFRAPSPRQRSGV